MLQKSLEASICMGIMIIFLILFFFSPPKIPEIEMANYKLFVFSSLEVMDKMGKLRDYALERNITKIKNELTRHLPYLVKYEVVIYNKTSNITKVPDILADDIVVVEYLLAGKIGNYSPLTVKVLSWGFE